MSAHTAERPHIPSVRWDYVALATAVGIVLAAALHEVVTADDASGSIGEIPPLTAPADPELVQYYIENFSCEALADELDILIDSRQQEIMLQDLLGDDRREMIARYDRSIASALQAYHFKCYSH